MTSPPEKIVVTCPACGHEYEDWYRASINLQLDDFDDDYMREATTATCPQCNTTVELGTLVVDRRGVWRLPPRKGVAEEP